MKKAILLLCVFLLTLSASAQDPQTGFPPYGSFENGGFDAINRQNLNVNFAIPIVSSPGRGQDFNFSIVYDSLLWTNTGTAWSPNSTWGWKKETPTGKLTFYKITRACITGPRWDPFIEETYKYFLYAFTDVAGTRHDFSLSFHEDPTSCNYNTGPRTGYATDGGGIYIDASNPNSPVIKIPDGTVFEGGELTDTNGNFFSKIIVSSTETHWKDTVGRIALKVKEIGSTSIEYRVLDPNGNDQLFEMTLENKSIKTNFACSSVTEYTGSGYLPTKIRLPNLLEYLFEYEVTPGYPTYTTGRLSKVILPTGGYYEYVYTGSNGGINCADGTVKGLTRKINDGSTTATWTFSRAPSGPSWITTVDAPELPYDSVGNRSKFTFDSNGWLTKSQIYQGTSTLKRTINTAWAGNGTPASATVILEDNKQSKTETTFDNYGNLELLKEYDWGSGAPGSIVRTTQMTYESGSEYTDRNIRNRLTQQIVKDASGTIKSRTDISYDESSYSNDPCVTDAAQHDNSGYGCSFIYRGNPTSVTSYTNPAGPSGDVARHFTYDSLGNLREADVDCCQQKEWKYQKSTSEYAYPYEVVSGPAGGPQLTVSFTYNSSTGLVASTTNENNKVTSFAYDVYKRLTQVTRPDSVQITTAYDDTNRTVTTDIPIQGTDKQKQRTYFDQLGRPFKQCLLNGSSSIISCTQRQYDELSRGYKVSNPFTGSASYWTEMRFDALGRQTTVIAPDGDSTTFSYSGNTVTVTDPTGKQRKSVTDGLGRLSKVYEPDVNSGNSLTQLTTNTYDVLNRLTQVSQGAQTRSYAYDGLGRLTSKTTPEAGTDYYYYTTAGGGNCSSNPSATCRRKDARNIVATYTYDGLNRLTQVSYSDSTPTVSFAYGTSAASNNNGRLITVTYNGSSNTESFTYDVLGQVTQATKKIDNVNYAVSYAYNLAVELTSITYPSGRVVTQSYDTIGRLSQVASGGTNYASGFAYSTAQQVTGFNYGNGVAASFGYSAQRLQLSSLKYTKGANTLFHTTYGYSQGGGNNGQITSISDNVESGRTVNYTYDALHRLKTAVTNGSGSYPQWGLSWTYDRYGNRTAQTVTAGTAPANSLSFSASTNRITSSGFSYDAAGNLTDDALNTYTYDAENRIKTKSGGTSATYYYDGVSLRVKKVAGGTTTRYIFSGTKVIAEYVNGAAVGSPTKEYIYSGSALLATLEGGTPTYHHADHLSARVNTNSSGTTVGQQGHYPFGESWYSTSTTTKWQFTAYERDAESGLDYAIFRYDNSRLGRFMTPDPIAGSIANPQSLNRYAYVRNDPVNLVDPLGLDVICFFGRTDDGGFEGCFDKPAGPNPIGCVDFILDGVSIGDNCGGGGEVRDPEKLEGRDLDALKKKLGKVLKKAECAALVGGKRRAKQLLKLLKLIDITAPGFTPRADHMLQYETLTQPGAAATTVPGIGSPIWVDNDFNTQTLQGQTTILLHEFRHQLFDLGEPNAETDRQGYDAFIRKEYEKIEQACFAKQKGKSE